MENIYGLHNIVALLETHPQTINKLYINREKSRQYKKIIDDVASKNIKTAFTDNVVLERMVKHNRHNGLVAEVSSLNHVKDKDDLLEFIKTISSKKQAIVVLLDGITDTNNLGAIIRSCECLGVDAIVVPQHNSAPVNHTVARVSAGAIYYIPIFAVNNLLSAVEILQEYSFIVASTVLSTNSVPLSQFAPTSKHVAWVLGNEETGVRPIIQKASDALIKLEMSGKTQSLNVSVTAALVVFDTINKLKSQI
jgi:23S rRNA (guanosine2251-2'-O)-methyltransferase